MDKGYILLWRGLLDSPVFASQMMLKIWIWCLCKANFKDRHVPLKVGKGVIIVSLKRGSFLFGRHKAEEELFIDGSTIYKAIKKIEDLGMISIVSNNQYSVITICKYNDYQDNENYKVATNEQVKDKQSTTEQQPRNTTNTLSNVNTLPKITNDIVDRKLKFSYTLKPFIEIYGSTFLNEFYKYWTEPNKSNTKFKQELEKTWSLERRLETWAKNDKNFNNKSNGESKPTEPLFGRQTAATVRANLSGWENLE